MQYQLFRLKMYREAQGDLFTDTPHKRESIYKLLATGPSGEFRTGSVWHIGNVELVDEEAVYFAIGRTARTIWERYDEGEKTFEVTEYPRSPYTHAIVDMKYGALAIGRKSSLQPTATGIATMLRKMLNSASHEDRHGYIFDIAPIKDPETLIIAIRDSFSVPRMISQFSRPNPFDVEAHFHKPIEKALESIGGSKGKVDIKGNLQKDRVVEVVKSHAASGDDLSVFIQATEGSKSVKKKLGKEYVKFEGPDDLDTQSKPDFVSTVQNYYEYVRDQTRDKD